MIDFLLIFGLTFLLSFLGSLQLGLVNSEVIISTIRGQEKRAIYIALGGSIPEIFYSGLATYLTAFIERIVSGHDQIVIIVTNIIIILVSLHVIFNSHFDLKEYHFRKIDENIFSPLFRGFFLGMINPQLLLFWTIVHMHVSHYIPIHGVANIFFCLGAFAGAYVLLMSFMFITKRVRGNFEETKSMHLIVRGLGVVLFFWAVGQIGNILLS